MALGNGDARSAAEVVWMSPSVRRETDDDLLTGGLGLEGLRAANAPLGASMRTRTIHTCFRELMDVTDAGGFGRLYGPRAAADLIVPGEETTALLRLRDRRHPFEVRLLIPDTFDRAAPLLVTAPSSGSRGVMGAIGDIGAWALTQGHALALTDKGTGVGVHLLGEGLVYGPNGDLCAPDDGPTIFAARPTSDRARFLDLNPHAVAFKHAHSQENVEADWPRFVLAATRWAQERLHERFAGLKEGATPLRTIAAGVSNGGGAALRAAEIDGGALIDGVVAAEPNVTPPSGATPRVMVDGAPLAGAGRAIYDIATLMALYAPVAALHPALADAPMADAAAAFQDRHHAWARALVEAGLLTGATPEARAQDALAKVREVGFEASGDALIPAMVAMQIWPAVAVTFANAYARRPVERPLCGVTFAFGTDGPRAPTHAEREALAAVSAGLAPSGGVAIIDPAGAPFLNLSTARALRALWVEAHDTARLMREGAEAARATARAPTRPIMIVHGRDDQLIHAGHSSRAYAAAVAARAPDAAARHLRYYEVDCGQHFEMLLTFPGFRDHYAPLTPYVMEALEHMRALLRDGRPPPPSQRAPARANGVRLEVDDLPPLAAGPHPAHRIELGRMGLSMTTRG